MSALILSRVLLVALAALLPCASAFPAPAAGSRFDA
jgi:hypothetical protein